MFTRAKEFTIILGWTIRKQPPYITITVEDWKQSFHNLPNLERLTLDNSITFQLLGALGSISSHEDGCTSGIILCPRLYSLCVYETTLPPLLFEHLSTFVQARTRGGCPIRELIVKLSVEDIGHDIVSEVCDQWSSVFRELGVDKVEIILRLPSSAWLDTVVKGLTALPI
jgi:hypothetical protein